MKQEVINKIAIWIVVFIVFSIIWFFWFKQYQVYKAESLVKTVNEVLEKNISSRDNCVPILEFDKTLIDNKDNKFFDEHKYDKLRKTCDLKYNIADSKIEENLCVDIIKENKSDFEDKYIILDEFDNIRNKCVSKFLKVEFGTGSFFDIENDFKSSVNINFSLDFFEDSDEQDQEAFIENRIKAKEKLISLL